MKHLLIITAFLLASLFSYGQTIKKDSVGNYYAIRNAHTDSVKVNETGLVFTDLNGVKYKIFKSAKNKLFYYRTAKSGNVYKVYVKETN